MEFKQGMLGVVIVSLALVGALFGNYLAGVEASQYEVTKYSYLADVSGLFDYDQSPQYITYDPSSNYTGYYSEESYSAAMDKYYFAEDDVSYTPNTDGRDPPNIRPNNYKLPLAPNVSEITSLDLTTLSITQDYLHLSYWLELVPTQHSYAYVLKNWDSNKNHTVYEIVENLQLLNSDVYVWIDLTGVNWTPSRDSSSSISIDAPMIVPSDWIKSDTVNIANPTITIDDRYTNGKTLYYPIKSMKVDVRNNSVSLYYGENYTNSVDKTYEMRNVYVCFGNDPSLIPNENMNLSDLFPYITITNQSASYLDPNYGVALKEANE